MEGFVCYGFCVKVYSSFECGSEDVWDFIYFFFGEVFEVSEFSTEEFLGHFFGFSFDAASFCRDIDGVVFNMNDFSVFDIDEIFGDIGDGIDIAGDENFFFVLSDDHGASEFSGDELSWGMGIDDYDGIGSNEFSEDFLEGGSYVSVELILKKFCDDFGVGL